MWTLWHACDPGCCDSWDLWNTETDETIGLGWGPDEAQQLADELNSGCPCPGSPIMTKWNKWRAMWTKLEEEDAACTWGIAKRGF